MDARVKPAHDKRGGEAEAALCINSRHLLWLQIAIGAASLVPTIFIVQSSGTVGDRTGLNDRLAT
jgi:hypothetical protein